MKETYGDGKIDVLEELHNKNMLNKKGNNFYNEIQKLKKKGWFDKNGQRKR